VRHDDPLRRSDGREGIDPDSSNRTFSASVAFKSATSPSSFGNGRIFIDDIDLAAAMAESQKPRA
jgi:hypothetical protein